MDRKRRASWRRHLLKVKNGYTDIAAYRVPVLLRRMGRTTWRPAKFPPLHVPVLGAWSGAAEEGLFGYAG